MSVKDEKKLMLRLLVWAVLAVGGTSCMAAVVIALVFFKQVNP
jgi:hypothetical protein